jgi:hypothetical protein
MYCLILSCISVLSTLCIVWHYHALVLKPYQYKSMHWIQLVDHWLWPYMTSTSRQPWKYCYRSEESNQWQLLPRVQSSPLVWVGDHNQGLLIYIFGNLCTSVNQSDTKAWDENDIGSTSHVTFFSPGCLITWWNHLIVWTTIDLGNAIFPIGLNKIFLITDDIINIVI